MKRIFSLILLFMLIVSLSACSDERVDGDLRVINPDDIYRADDVYYQLFVRSFADSDGDGIGDFKGITENLDYLENLGIGGIWLMPIHPSPSYHGYDVTDYYRVNEEYGTMEDFEELLEESKKRDIDIVIDFVINHSSYDHPWFQAAKDPSNADYEKYHDYYTWIDESDERFGKLGSWNQNIWHKFSGEYYAGYFTGRMPDLNFNNDDVKKEMINIGKYWIEKGVDGFRLDAALHMFGKNENVLEISKLDANLQFLNEFTEEMHKVDSGSYIFGEVWETPNIFTNFVKSTDATLNFEIGDLIINSVKSNYSTSYADSIDDLYGMYEESYQYYIDAPFIRNHDQDRIATQLYGNVEKIKLAAEMLLTLSGTPILYYGEELGMRGAKSFGPYYDETRRLPFIWGDSTYTTFWHPDTFNTGIDDVTTQLSDENSILNVYKSLINVRNNHLALSLGKFYPLSNDSGRLQSYIKYHDSSEDSEDEVLLVLHNLSEFDMIYDFDEYSGEVVYYSRGITSFDSEMIAPYSTVIIKIDAIKIERYIK